MKIALVFWGLTRSLKITYPNIKKNILDHLNNNNIEYKIFLHSYYFKGNYNDRRTGEKNIKLDFEEYKLLNPDYFIIDNQDEIKEKINIKQYQKLKFRYNLQTTTNLICALYSQMKATELLEKNIINENEYDYVWYLRSDVLFKSKLSLHWLKWINNNRFLVPRFGKCDGINDRMAIMKYQHALSYGKRFLKLYNYGKNKKISSEKFLNDIMYNIKKKPINYLFKRIRANGLPYYLDNKLF